MATPKERADDAFFKKILWWMGGLALASAGSIIAIEVQILNLEKTTKEIRKTNRALKKLNIVLTEILAASKYRNKIAESEALKTKAIQERQLDIYIEQQTRGYRLEKLEGHVRKRKIHKRHK